MASHDAKILRELETIDDDLEDMDVRLVKLPADDDANLENFK